MNLDSANLFKGDLLIIDDSPANLRVLSTTLIEQGYDVRCVKSGSMALIGIQASPPDLILLDIRMPVMDGYQVCQQLKTNVQTQHIPIIFLSALDDVLDKIKAFEVGGVDYITKPFQIEEVLARVERQLTIRRLQKQLTEQNQRLQQEILERKQIEEALRQEIYTHTLTEAALHNAKEVAEAANRAKSEFLSRMTHELRTPLNAILGFTEVMSHDKFLRQEHYNYLGIINRSGKHLLALINDVLEMSKIEAGRVKLQESSFNLHSMLNDLESLFRVRAATKQLTLVFQRTADVPQYLITDESKLRQVLLNLLDNAIKFTEQGKVALRVSVKYEGQSRGEDAVTCPAPCTLHFEVEDTGSGIAPEEMRNLFRPFVQTRSGQQLSDGTGLGLAISHTFVQLMGGALSSESVLGQGSRFYFDIQVTSAQGITASKVCHHQRISGLAANQPSYRLLIVEDHWENGQLLMEMLRSVGFEVQVATNGQEGIAVWQQWQPHLIWMDMRMPIMDGYEATRQIKSTATGQATVIIAVTSSAFEEDRTAMLSIGCDDFISKPFQAEVIFAKLTEHLGVQYVYEESTLPPAVPNGFWGQPENSGLTFEQLQEMPKGWLAKLHQAAAEGRDYQVLELIQQIPDPQAELISALKTLAYNFCFEELLQLTQPLIAPSVQVDSDSD
ncbi:MAG TPA: response regulator [Coleofasciculaceae cyanobacterium]